MTVKEFCQKYRLGHKIYQLLDDEGFEMAGALFMLKRQDLENAKWKMGHIAELERALNEFASIKR